MVRIFISYAQKDEAFKNELENHLAPLKIQRIIESWNDKEILPGGKREEEIRNQIEKSQLILFLISSDFIASKYSNNDSINRALDKHRNEEAIVIPVILRPTDYSFLEISEIEALPKDGRSISEWPNQDAAWIDVVKEIKRVIDFLNNGSLMLKVPSKPLDTEDGNNDATDGNSNVTFDSNKIKHDTKKKKGSRNKKEGCHDSMLAEIKLNIAKGRTEVALTILLELVEQKGDSDLSNQTILLTARFNKLKKDQNMGIISYDASQKSLVQIDYAILSVLKDLKN